MALLDLSSLLIDPDLVDKFNVERRQEFVDNKGRGGILPTMFYGIIGVVGPISPSELDRRDDYQLMRRSLEVITKFRLQGEVNGYQPDIIYWRGDRYLVRSVDNFPQFGAGFFRVECTSIDKTESQLLANSPQLAFNTGVNSGHLGAL